VQSGKEHSKDEKKRGLAVIDNSKVLTIPRAQPPDELSDEEATEWRAFTNRMPADYFGREHYPMLVQLCRHIVAERCIAQLIDQERASPDINVSLYLKLLRAQKEETGIIGFCLRTMRLTHQSNVPANTSRTPPVTLNAPWIRQEEED
jgi:hypothetical protein